MGTIIALIIIAAWGSHLVYILGYVTPDFASPWLYFHILFQGYLYTGLFITAHDAMHGVVAPGKKMINKTIGSVASLLFAGMSYKQLKVNHFKHHKHPGTAQDPDFYIPSQNFFLWWGSFLLRYTTISQLIIMAVAYNLMNLYVSELNLWLFWIIPAFLGTFQLFYFGTYLPHRKPHDHDMEPHKARTQKKNHLLAMLSCYFFGYHFEHHHAPHKPWWKLYSVKEELFGK